MTRRAAVCLISLLAGIALAFAIAPWVFVRLPNDRERIGYLLRALHDPPHDLHTVILGNSVAMFGVDARALPPRAWNLGSSGQTLAESFLLFERLPAGVRTVVLVVTPTQVFGNTPLDALGWNAWYMYGYRPSTETVNVLTMSFGPPMRSLLSTPEIVQRFRSRWVVRAGGETLARTLLRRDPDWKQFVEDLEFPAQQRVRPGRWIWPANGGQAFAIDAPDRLLVESLVQRAARRGQTVVIVLAPLSSVARRFYGRSLVAYRAVHFGAAPVLDAVDLLEPREFLDGTHPTKPGAMKWTRLLAAYLGGRR